MSTSPMHRKGRILVISFTAAAFAVLAGFVIRGYSRTAALRQQLAYDRQHAFAELTTAVYEMDAALQKVSCASSPSLISALCTDLFGKSMEAQMSLGELPYGNVELEQTADFIARVGDYAAALSKSAAAGRGWTGEERETVQALAKASSTLSQSLLDLQSDLYAGQLTLEDLEQVRSRLAGGAQSAGARYGGEAFQAIEEEFPEVPSLLYDGPFSQHLEGRSPKLLEGMEQVSQAQGQACAAAFLGLDPGRLVPTSAGGGALPTWGYSAQTQDGELYVEVTQTGGVVLSLLTSRIPGEEVFSASEGIQLSQDFLAVHGFSGMEPTYSMRQGHVLTVNFAYRQGEVLCYSDLIQVEVALDIGKVTGFEAAGYVTHHAQRTLPTPTLTLDQAQHALSPSLKLLAHQLALIPTAGEDELLCMEFKCATQDGRHCLIYLNALTGVEEKILLLLEDENGSLVL